MISLCLYIVFLAFYLAGFLILSVGWNKVKDIENSIDGSNKKSDFSILIPFRNEGKNIKGLISTLIDLNYNNLNFEVIFINDNSDDNGVEIVTEMISNQDNFILINSSKQGKKNAITEGVAKSKFENIITIDGDCKVRKELLNEYSKKIQLGFQFVSAPVVYSNSKILNYELIGLVGIGASTLFFNKPTMANGANLGFKKSIFEKLNGYEGNNEVASGDDEFLLRKFVSNGCKVGFLKSENAIVKTEAPHSFKEFINQRIRWSSKWRMNSFGNMLAPIFMFFLYFLQISLLFQPDYYKILMPLLIAKIVVEIIFMFPVLKFFGKENLILNVFIVQIYYPFYIIFVGLISIFTKHYNWKGRIVK